jgi:20S proteasome alpha/beta subunit
MTIAIGAPFIAGSIHGALVCADSRVVATDGATTWGSKMHLKFGVDSGEIKSCFAIAGAADDADASTMLSQDITNALCDDSVVDQSKVDIAVKQQMTAWYSAYGRGNPPTIQFVLAAVVGGKCSLIFCSPPNTISRRQHPFAVGQGARAIDPLLPNQASPPPTAESAILRATYWMYRAKRDEGSLCGGCTNMAMISERGTFALIEKDEVEAAEALGEQVDKLLQSCRYGLLSWESQKAQQQFLRSFSQPYLELAAKAKKILFPTLTWLEGLPKSDKKQPTKQPTKS